jgi:hypothetical protein
VWGGGGGIRITAKAVSRPLLEPLTCNQFHPLQHLEALSVSTMKQCSGHGYLVAGNGMPFDGNGEHAVVVDPHCKTQTYAIGGTSLGFSSLWIASASIVRMVCSVVP